MPEQLASFIYMYRDDTNIFRSVNNDIHSASLQHDPEQLVQWEQKFQLHFNAQKCEVMHNGGDITRWNQLAYSTQKKDLGVWISNDFKASSHVAKGVSKANPDPFQGLSRWTFTHLDCQLMKQLLV